MEELDDCLNEEDAFHAFLKTKIRDLQRDKRELVGVFGETGAGKSSLINAIIGEKNLLPSVCVSACTAVMIKLEANVHSQKYEAEIEFITKEEWEEEVRYACDNKADEENEDDDYYCDTAEKLTALYGDEWSKIDPENLMDRKYFREIPEFLNSKRKFLSRKSVEDLSAKVVKYTRNGSSDEECGEVKRQLLEPEDTEIPKLQEFLRNLNDSHSETSKYVSGALGILSVIQGARSGAVPGTKSKVRTELENKLNELSEIRKPIEEAYKAFEKCLTEGVEKSEGSWKPININVLLASHLADSVDEEFKKTFPNDRKSEPFDGVVSRFSLGAERLTEKYKGVELQLTFLKTKEKKIKTELNKIIREEKKKIYNSLTETIQDSMQGCYKEAAGFTGAGTLEKMRKTLEKHVCDSKNVMFKQAKYSMLEQLKELMEYVLKKLEKTLKESIELSLKTDEHPLPDVSAQLKLVKRYYNQLKGEPDQTEVDDVDTEASRDQTSPSGENLERNVPAEISADERLLAVRTQFIDSVSESVLKSLLDELLQHRKNTKAKTAREVIDMVRRKGSKASRVLITALCKVDPFLSKELKLM
ncbi:hypothetical protein Q5P01_004384 [Channa striata]|uniref:CARD domain-containing protein n=1 Tax=Channa striata TaxID=64152 RepID=A0AA88NIT8_CHASR|nr:hypothetical protein Q5P01_004384 [Channa striata]